MSQKINPISYRLGLSQRWFKNFQLYGKNLYFFNFYHLNYLLFFIFLSKNFYKQKVFCFKTESWLSKSIFYISFHLIDSQKKLKKFYEQNLTSIMNFWASNENSNSLKLRFFNYSYDFCSNLFFNSYIDYLFKELKYKPKKIVGFLLFFLMKKLNKSNLILLTKFGPKKFLLKGFKLQLSGRFDLSSKTEMSKMFKIKIGKITSTNFNSTIDFINKPIYTKLGVCNFKIWLFYKI